MNILTRWMLGLAGVAALGVATPTFAVSAFAGANSFSYRVYDIDLADGIAPSLTFLPYHYTLTSLSIYQPGEQSVSQSGANWATGSGVNGFGSASAGQCCLSASSTATSGSGAITESRSLTSVGYRLGAGTGLEITYHGSYRTVGQQVGDLASVESVFMFTDSTTRDTLSFYQFISSNMNNGADGIYEIDHSFSVQNYSAQFRDVQGSASIKASVSTTAPPVVVEVPEPETYALMLAGLGLMGAVARRRKAKQA